MSAKVIPFVVEVWARRANKMSVAVCVNRTPVAAEVHVQRKGDDKNKCVIFGCNLGYAFQVGKGNYEVLINAFRRNARVARTTMDCRPRLSGESKVTNVRTIVGSFIETVRLRNHVERSFRVGANA